MIRANSAVLVALLWALPATSAAQETNFQVEQFEPLPSQGTNTLSVARSAVLPHLAPSAGVFLHFVDDPMVISELGADEDVQRSRLIDDQLKGELGLAIGLFDFADLSVMLPVVLYQSGDDATSIGGGAGAEGFTFSDLRLIPKIRLIDSTRAAGFGLAVLAPIYLPAGDTGTYNSDGGVRFAPRLIADYSVDAFNVAANVGYQARPKTQSHNYVSDDLLQWGVAATAPLGADWVALNASLIGSVGLSEGIDPGGLDEIDNLGRNRPMEALGAVKFSFGNFALQFGGGAGLTSAVGSPDFRLFAGIDFVPTAGDRDADGLTDDIDGCADGREDIDGFEDDDGCPDPDNDGDLVLDEVDKCPMQAEDTDLYQDADGCPDPDNDGDGILDFEDSCPQEVGVPEKQGCPQRDGDGDGIDDADDQCPAKAEDIDQYRDDDGCPDPDNDQDGILDPDDKCPLEPEVINGVDDTDGCPDVGQSAVRLTGTKIEILERVYFDTNRATIKQRSFNVLTQVAAVLKANPQIASVRIEGHTDDRGRDAYNLDLSQRRANAVLQFLIGREVAESRLSAVGYGETHPIADNTKSTGRDKNRRVEFVIVDAKGSKRVKTK